MMEQNVMQTTAQSTTAQSTMAPQEVLTAASAYSQSQKGAIIIALLGAEHAKPLVEAFDDEHLRSFVAAMQTIQFTPRPILLATIAEFINDLGVGAAAIHGNKSQNFRR